MKKRKVLVLGLGRRHLSHIHATMWRRAFISEAEQAAFKHPNVLLVTLDTIRRVTYDKT